MSEDKYKRLTIKVEPGLHAQFKRFAGKKRKTMTELVLQLITDGITAELKAARERLQGEIEFYANGEYDDELATIKIMLGRMIIAHGVIANKDDNHPFLNLDTVDDYIINAESIVEDLSAVRAEKLSVLSAYMADVSLLDDDVRDRDDTINFELKYNCLFIGRAGIAMICEDSNPLVFKGLEQAKTWLNERYGPDFKYEIKAV